MEKQFLSENGLIIDAYEFVIPYDLFKRPLQEIE